MKVCIVSAGLGTRLGTLTQDFNKALVDVNHKPAVSHVIEKFPKETTEYVIAVGYKSDTLKQYLQLAHADRNITCVDISTYQGPGSGLGRTLLDCEKYLQEPFIFTSNDTLVDEPIPLGLENNWVGYEDRKIDAPSQYRTLQIEDGIVTRLLEKNEREFGVFAYLGLAGIKDWQTFWSVLRSGQGYGAIEQGEAFAIREMLRLKMNVSAVPFTWHDLGNPDKLSRLQKQYKDVHNILPKDKEKIWFVNGLTIKYFENKDIVQQKVTRAKILKGFVPEIIGHTDNMFSYAYTRGKTITSEMTVPLFKRLLEHCEKFWMPVSFNSDKSVFPKACGQFYKDKTYERVRKFRATDKKEIINDIEVPSVYELLEKVPWEDFQTKGVSVRWHGDLHNENIVLTESGQFLFLDWRQEFSGLNYGDLSFEIAKIWHSFEVSHPQISLGNFSFEQDGDIVKIGVLRPQIMVECEEELKKWIAARSDLSLFRIRILVNLIYLQIACLHHSPYNSFLWYFGKYNLFKALNEPQS